MVANIYLLASLAIFSAFTLSAASHDATHHRHSHNKKRITISPTSAASTSLQQRAAPILPTDWQYVGCYADGTNRVLPTKAPFPEGAAMTQAICAAHCNTAGFTYAGLEYMWECYCGNTLDSAALSESECSMPCTGDASQKCGGPYKLNVFKKGALPSTPTTPTTFTELGCYTDQESRTLSAYTFETNSLTREMCASTCASKGYAYAGVEYMFQCYCGNTISSGATKLASSDCAMPCAGNSAQVCGSGWRINILSLSAGGDTPTPTPTPNTGYTAVGCFEDDWSRTLTTVGNVDTSGQTVQKCTDICKAKSLPYAGVETGSECWCGSKISQGRTKLSSDATCSMPCTGNSSQKCGGAWRLNVYHNPAYDREDVPDETPSTGGGTLDGDWWTGSGSSSGKLVVAHFMMGNCYSYSATTWLNEIRLAKSQGIDAFALNMGNDAFIRGQVAAAYQAAQASGTGFKMFFSFDVTAMGCSSNDHANNIRGYLSQYNNHAAQLKDSQGRAIVSTFSGEYCYFGRGSVNEGWNYAVKEGFNTNFIPSFFGDPRGFDSLIPARNGDFYWNGGWPLGNFDVSFADDDYHLSFNSGRTYMTGVSPAFFTHYGADSWNKNWIYKSDNHLYANRWEQIIQQRNKIDIVQIVTWNDYGEASYVGPIGVDQPNSQAWTNGYDHQAYLAITGFYAAAFKSGSMPTIVKDKIFMCSRPHSKHATAQNDPIGKPRNWEWTEDNIYVVLFSKGAGQLTVSADGQSKTVTVAYGVNKISIPSSSNMAAKLVRDGTTVFNFAPSGFTYYSSPPIYNFNYFAAHGP